MDSSSWTLEPISQDNLLVTVALVLAAILAVLTIIGMVVGARNKRKRVAAEQDEQARMEALREDGIAPSNRHADSALAPPPPVVAKAAEPAAATTEFPAPTPAPFQEAPRPAPVAPAPPPLSDQPAPGMPEESTPIARPSLADEPIAAAAPLDASPASVAASDEQASMPIAASVPEAETDGPEPVTRLKGLGPRIATKLAEHGITTIDELAALTDEQAAALDAQMGPFQGRIERDRWREQARLLADGDRAGFEREFGKLG